jgi:hypothetical protein
MAMSIGSSKNRSLSVIDCDEWWGGKDFKLEPAQPPPVEWGYIPKSPFTGRCSSRSGRRPASQEYPPNERPKTAPAWSGSSKEVGTDWDNRHHITFSRNNQHFPSSLREYFPDKPRVPMARKSMHVESFAPLDHTSGRTSLFQRPPEPAIEHPPKFSHEIWRQADPFLVDSAPSSSSSVASVCAPTSSTTGSIQGVHCDISLISRRSPGGTMRNQETGEVEDWDDRASTCISQHNGKLHSNQREYFFYDNSSFSPPPDYHHNLKWRNLSPGKSRHLEVSKPTSSASQRQRRKGALVR